MIIRTAAIQDCKSIAEVHVDSWKTTYAGQLPDEHLAQLSVPNREAAWRDSLTKKEHNLLVTTEGDRVLGFVSFGPSRDRDATDNQTGEIYAIYLLPSSQGQGTGKALWNEACRALKDRGFNKVTVWVLDTNLRARHFYERRDCVLDGGQKASLIGGQEVLELRYKGTLMGSP